MTVARVPVDHENMLNRKPWFAVGSAVPYGGKR